MASVFAGYRPKSIDEHWLIQAMLAPIPRKGSGVLINL